MTPNYTTPPKLKPGDQLRIIAPAQSMGIISKEVAALATQRLEALGLTVSFSEHCFESDLFHSSSIAHRVDDLHAAFADPNVHGILTVIGGFNANQLLPYLDYDLIARHPKVLCGYSDITILNNILLAKSNLVTYYGPHFSSFGERDGFDYSLDYFKQAVMTDDKVDVTLSPTWSDDPWYRDQDHRTMLPNDGWWVINPGTATGTAVGGNQCTLNLLQGTPYMPSLNDTILFVEDDYEAHPRTFDRDLESLTQLPDFSGVRGIVIGRFQTASNMTRELLEAIICTKPALAHLPVITNVDFGHTTPRFTIPIGGQVELRSDTATPTLTLRTSA